MEKWELATGEEEVVVTEVGKRMVETRMRAETAESGARRMLVVVEEGERPDTLMTCHSQALPQQPR